jgi:putative phage-type endonuclease
MKAIGVRDQEARRTGLGGSDAPRVILDPWALWLEKTGQAAPIVETERMAWGARLEAVVAAYYAERNGVRPKRSAKTWRHREYPFLYAHPDRLVGEGGLEVKTTGSFGAKEWGPDGSAQVPIRVRLQVLHYLAVLDRPWWDVAVLIGGQEYRQYRIIRDDDEVSELVWRELEFWRLVETGTPPAVDDSEAATQWLTDQRKEVIEPVVVDLTEEMERAASQYAAARKAKEMAEEAMRYYGNVIRNLLLRAGATKAMGDRFVVSWSERAGARRIDPKKLIELLSPPPEVVEAATTVGEPTYVVTVQEVEA